jgi:hypothetical protein
MMLRHPTAYLITVYVLLSTEHRAQSVEIDVLLNSHQSSLVSLSLLKTEIVQTVEYQGRATEFRALYSRSPQSSRIREIGKNGETSKDVVLRDGKQKATFGHVDKQNGSRYVAAIIAPHSEMLCDMDGWELSLCALPGIHKSWSALLEEHRKSLKLSTLRVSDKQCTSIDLPEVGGIRRTIVFDPSVNYLVCKLVTYSSRAGDTSKISLRSEYSVEGFDEIAPGTFFPKSVTMNYYENDVLDIVHRTTFKNTKTVPAFPSDEFEIAFPAGVTVVDKIAGTVYKIDAREVPVGEIKKYNPVATMEPQKPSPPLPETVSSWNWLTYLSIAMILFGVYVIVRSKLKRS